MTCRPEDGPRAEVVKLAELAQRLPFHQQARTTSQEYTERIAARQAAVARRMLG